MELKVGKTVEIDGFIVECFEREKEHNEMCDVRCDLKYGYKPCCNLKCLSGARSDGKNVYYKLLSNKAFFGVSVAVTKNCKNLEESYGEICVRCKKCNE